MALPVEIPALPNDSVPEPFVTIASPDVPSEDG